MLYVSTRGQAPVLSFEEVVTTGVAKDGGLYVPEVLPTFSTDQIKAMRGMSYQELAFTVMQPFVAGDIEDDVLKSLIDKAYASFRHDAIAPVVPLHDNVHVLELFHGPTLAFKDFALQFLGQLFDYVLSKEQRHVTIIGATSGDTGSAAIEGCKHSEWVNMFIFHPHNRVSEVQRRQMTTVLADNVFNIAVESDFDFCQSTVKHLFNDQEFLQGKTQFVAVNSINWCRIMAQIVYYFYASFQVGGPEKEVSFSVPTGNFGDIYAGYLAKQMGLPIKHLVIATNTNDILHRFLQNNDYSRGTLVPTVSPSMDIQVSSNFERLLFDLHHRDGAQIKDLMDGFQEKGALSVSQEILDEARKLFKSAKCDDATTIEVITQTYQKYSMVVDPHTAAGVYAAAECASDNQTPMVILATAHPTKFADAIERAGVCLPDLPGHLSDLLDRKEQYKTLPDSLDAIKDYISARI